MQYVYIQLQEALSGPNLTTGWSVRLAFPTSNMLPRCRITANMRIVVAYTCIYDCIESYWFLCSPCLGRLQYLSACPRTHPCIPPALCCLHHTIGPIFARISGLHIHLPK